MMKQMRCLLFLTGLLLCLQPFRAATYSVDNLPMVYLQDKTRHVVNPDGILSASAVTRMDSLLFRMEAERGVQSVVAVVERIEGGDCYDFSITLGNKLGIGNQQNTGLIILLSTQDRCYQILTGEGLEGTLPDAICRRIENRYMVPYLKNGDWDTAMLHTVEAVAGIVLEDEALIPSGNQRSKETDYSFIFTIMALFIAAMLFSWYSNRKRNTCPRCGHTPMQRTNSTVTADRYNGVEHHTETYRCPKCGYTHNRSHDEPLDNGTGFGGGMPPFIFFPRGGSRGGGFGGGFGGGSFGGGSFGGGGAGGRF